MKHLIKIITITMAAASSIAFANSPLTVTAQNSKTAISQEFTATPGNPFIISNAGGTFTAYIQLQAGNASNSLDGAEVTGCDVPSVTIHIAAGQLGICYVDSTTTQVVISDDGKNSAKGSITIPTGK